MFAFHGNQIALTKLVQGYRHSSRDSHGHYISTKAEGRKLIKLKVNEIVLQVHWQETLRGHVAGVLTTHRVFIASADLEILLVARQNLIEDFLHLDPFCGLVLLSFSLLLLLSVCLDGMEKYGLSCLLAYHMQFLWVL